MHGSQWLKWDLHFHTPSSYDYDNNSVTNEDIVETLVSQNISVVAITDHNVIDTLRIRELQRIGKGKITVLPGIEFLSDARGSEPIHFIAVFSEDCNLEYIWKQIESKTEINQIEKNDKKPWEVYCHLFDTIKLIKELDGIVTIHAGSKTNGIEKITNSLPHNIAQKEDIAKAIDIFELGKEKDVDDYNNIVLPFLLNKIGKRIPLIICSDNHDINNYHSKQNLWIKAAPTFEGLRQICFEPQSRVKIQMEKPEFREERLFIEKVRFLSTENTFLGKYIYFNQNLNVIIGGKSSGKSILLYSIAKTLISDKALLYNEDYMNKYDFNKLEDGLNFEVTTGGGFTQNLSRADDENSILPEIKYIPQNYLVKLAEPDLNGMGRNLNELVRQLITENHLSKELYEQFVDKLKENDKTRNSKIDQLFETAGLISSLIEQLKSKPNKDILNKNIETNTLKVEELSRNSGLTLAQIEEYKLLQSSIEMNSQHLQKIKDDLSVIQHFNKEVVNTVKNLLERKKSSIAALQLNEVKSLYELEYADIDTLLKKAEKIDSDIEIETLADNKRSFKHNNIFKEILNTYAVEKNRLNESIQPYLKNEQLKKTIEELNKSIINDKRAILDIDVLKEKINENELLYTNIKNDIFDTYSENFQLYIDVINNLKGRTSELEKDGLKINGKAHFNFPKLRKDLQQISDGRSASFNQYHILNQTKKATDEYDYSELLSQIKLLVDDIISRKYSLNTRTTIISAVKLVLEDYFFDGWEIIYKKDRLGEMSTGKASFVILMLIIGLSKSKAPILIDQPEDNLDNRSITTDLVNYLRNKKTERQIIIVTHNANIVVNADAENIIVANQKGQTEEDTSSPYKFDYINGPIEHTYDKISTEKDLLKSMGIRQHIAEIVEGGKEAFIMREKRYRFR